MKMHLIQTKKPLINLMWIQKIKFPLQSLIKLYFSMQLKHIVVYFIIIGTANISDNSNRITVSKVLKKHFIS